MRDILFILSVIGFIISFIMVEIFFIKKSKQKILEAIKAYRELKEAEKTLKGGI